VVTLRQSEDAVGIGNLQRKGKSLTTKDSRSSPPAQRTPALSGLVQCYESDVPSWLLQKWRSRLRLRGLPNPLSCAPARSPRNTFRLLYEAAADLSLPPAARRRRRSRL